MEGESKVKENQGGTKLNKMGALKGGVGALNEVGFITGGRCAGSYKMWRLFCPWCCRQRRACMWPIQVWAHSS